MTQTPGTPAYMPPEVMIANPKYDTSVDEFYGILMIHMFSGRWPEPQVGPSRIEASKLIPVTEAERREVFLQAIGNDHPLMNLIHKCINNDPQLRPHASEIIGQLAEMMLQFPVSFANILEILRHIEVQQEEKRALREEGERKDRVIQQNEEQISIYRKGIQAKDQQKAAEIDQLKLVHSSEVEQLRLQVRGLNAQKQLLNDEKEAEVAEMKSKVTAYETHIENNAKTLLQEREQFDTQLNKERGHFEKALAKKTEEFEIQLAKKRGQFETQLAKKTEESETQLAKEREQFETQVAKEREQLESQLAKEKEQLETWLAKKTEEQLAKEREVSRKLAMENHDLLSEVSKLRTKTDTLQRTISTLKADVMLKDGNISSKNAAITKKESELEAKIRVLQEKDAIISGMSEQLTRARECLATKQQVSSTGNM